jgi:hypothetical protein
LALYIKFREEDLGARPPAGSPWPYPEGWHLSPSLQPMRGGSPVAAIVAGLDYGVRAIVHNNGNGAVPGTQVQVWAHRFATVATPAAVLKTFTLTRCPGSPCTVPAAAAAMAPAQVVFTSTDTWTAPADEAHVCLFANCFAPTDGVSVADPAALDVQHVPRHAQRNLAYVRFPAILGKLQELRLVLWTGNPDPDGDGEFELVVRKAPRRLPVGELLQVLTAPGIQRLARLEDDGAPAPPDLLRLPRDFRPTPLRGLRLEVDGRVGSLGKPVPLNLDRGAGRPVNLELAFGRTRRPGWQAIDVEQRSVREGRLLGAARIVAVGLPRRVFDEVAEAEAVS